MESFFKFLSQCLAKWISFLFQIPRVNFVVNYISLMKYKQISANQYLKKLLIFPLASILYQWRKLNKLVLNFKMSINYLRLKQLLLSTKIDLKDLILFLRNLQNKIKSQ